MRHYNTLPSCGTSFQGRRLVCRLDSDRKTYRRVYKCDETEEVIIIYSLTNTPDFMMDKNSKLPVEYEFFQVFGRVPLSGLPELIESGFDDAFAWIITRYIELTKLTNLHLGDATHDATQNNNARKLISAVSSSFKNEQVFSQIDYHLYFAPDNICFLKEGDEYRVVVVGLDTALFPMYPISRTPSFVDARYFAPELLKNHYSRKSASYSLALCILTAVHGDFPFNVQNTGGIIPAELTVKAVTEHAGKSEIYLPTEYEMEFRKMLLDSPQKRLLLGERVHTLSKRVDETPMGLDDVGGHEDFKKEIEDIEFILSFPHKAKLLGIKIPNYLLVGPPGTGKSFFARKACEDLGIPTLTVNVSDMEGAYYGESSQKIETLFQRAKKMAEEKAGNNAMRSADGTDNAWSIAPVAIIIDELEAVGQKRNSDLSPGAVSTTSTLLQFIDKCEEYHAIIFATSNNISNIESSVYRNGRFIRKYFGFPDDKEKEAVLKCVLKRRNAVIDDSDYPKLVAQMNQFVPGDIEEAAKTAAKMALKAGGIHATEDFIAKQPDQAKWSDDYQRFIHESGAEMGYVSFTRWCKLSNNHKLLKKYLAYCRDWDADENSTPINFSMMRKAIEMTIPSSTKAQEREYESIYQEFLPDSKRKQRTIGF